MRLRMIMLAGAIAVASPLQAQVYLTPNVGAVFAGDTDDSKVSYGGSLTFAGESSVIGFAVDFAYTPEFFGSSDLTDNNVTSLMGNLVLMSPGRTRVYGSGGIGLLKTRVQDVDGFFDIDSNELGMNVGGGFIFLPDRIGFQADVRYFRNLTDPEPDDEFDIDLGGFNFWRASGGVVFRF
jgi:hypothetical protein